MKQLSSASFLVRVLLLFVVVNGAHQFSAHRLVQFDKNGQQFGSRRAVITQIAASHKLQEGVSRRMVLVHAQDLTVDKLTDLVDNKHAAGLLVILPQDESLLDKAAFGEIEQYFFSRAFQIPVYFAFEDSELTEMVQYLDDNFKASDTGVDRFQIVAPGPEPTELVPVRLYNFQAWIRETAAVTSASGEYPSSIAVIANYDTFGAAPGLSFGLDESGSGTVALLELLRIFSRIFQEYRVQGGSKNILFLLTSGGRLNFAGSKQWLQTADSRMLESVEFALCLDRIGSADPLFLHVTRPGTQGASIGENLVTDFEAVAEHMDVKLTVRDYVTEATDGILQWEHEHFAKRKILSGTLSTSSTATPLFRNSSIADKSVDVVALERNIKFVAEVLASYIYHSSSGSEAESSSSFLEVTSGPRGVSPTFVNAWLEFLSSQPRVAPFLDRKSRVIEEIEKVIDKYASDSIVSVAPLPTNFKFYVSNKASLSTELSVYKVKPFTFDILLSISVMLYLAIYYFLGEATFKIIDDASLSSASSSSSSSNGASGKKSSNKK
eukprot:TRINITY_DN8281_c0_g1_i1.p1 TRINITY_DN8281_c0_g1~~TRINITY_DN8281_c0_g1_i1.p1  ORF type:complete len:607 (+),score=168.47 TRINITY_DN8281_c0_g1_i1:169-1821(+)